MGQVEKKCLTENNGTGPMFLLTRIQEISSESLSKSKGR